tara:strand:- start:42 stop:626 length:585 start_codon:yes stop_codon:yes gene_type:complete
MAELYDDWLSGPMTRAEALELSPDDKEERKRLRRKIFDKQSYERNKIDIKKKKLVYYHENKEKFRENRNKYARVYYQENKDEILKKQKKYSEEHKEERQIYLHEYNQTAQAKKIKTLHSWTYALDLQESSEDLDRIYELRETQELCNACDVKLTRNGDRCNTDATMDHDHNTHRFRHIICRSCNTMDTWKKYFC